MHESHLKFKLRRFFNVAKWNFQQVWIPVAKKEYILIKRAHHTNLRG